MIATPLEAAYTAGLFDGEGSIHIGWKGRAYNLQIQVSNTNYPVLLWLRAHWGGAIYEFKGQDRRGRNWSRCWSWSLSVRDDKQDFLEAVLPHLIVKRRPAEIGLEFLKIRTRQGIGLTPAAAARQHELFLEYRASRGISIVPDELDDPQLAMEMTHSLVRGVEC